MANYMWLRSKLRCITVEPSLFFYMFSTNMVWITVQELIYRKVCVANFNSTVCANLTAPEYETEENQVQGETAHWFIGFNLIFELPALFFSLVYGNVSDYVSRRLALVIPLIGQVMAATVYLINATIDELPIGAILVGPVFSGCFGGWIAFCIGTFSYISDDSSNERRTLRIGVAEGVLNLSMALASFVGGVTLDHTSFAFVFSMTLVLFVIGVMYTIFVLRDPDGSNAEQNANANIVPMQVKIKEGISKSLSPKSILQTVKTLVKKRSMNKRKLILLMFTAMILTSFSLSPYRFGLCYLFLKRHPLGWSQTLYGYYTGFRLVITALGLLIALPLLKHKGQVRETTIMLTSIVTVAVSEVLFALSTETWMVFMATTLAFMDSCTTACARSILSTLVHRNELGQIFAVMGSMQSAGGMLISTVFNNLYPLTLNYWAGICFVLGAVVSGVPLAILSYLHVKLRAWESFTKLHEETECDIQQGDTVIRNRKSSLAK